MIASIFDLEKNRNMLWNQGSQLFHLPHETEFFHEIFIFSTSLMAMHDAIGAMWPSWGENFRVVVKVDYSSAYAD